MRHQPHDLFWKYRPRTVIPKSLSIDLTRFLSFFRETQKKAVRYVGKGTCAVGYTPMETWELDNGSVRSNAGYRTCSFEVKLSKTRA
jgi:hypothetical protein